MPRAVAYSRSRTAAGEGVAPEEITYRKASVSWISVRMPAHQSASPASRWSVRIVWPAERRPVTSTSARSRSTAPYVRYSVATAPILNPNRNFR